MDWKVFVSTFGVIFLAELGDKTQMTALALGAGRPEKAWSIAAATSVALVAAALLGVFAGKYLGAWIDPKWLRIGSGCLFLTFGALMLFDRMP